MFYVLGVHISYTC